MSTDPREATEHVLRQHAALRETLPFDQDTADADRGLLARWEGGVIRTEGGDVAWDVDAYPFLEGEAPDTVNPSLWRHSEQVARQGLFEVVEGVYQVRGLDISNVTFVEGDEGVVVIDPLLSVECAAAAIALYRENRGDRPVTGVLYTHSHIDHFGGVKGVVTQEEVDSGRVPVVAPIGFLEHAVGENVYAGTAMARRAGYMYGAALERGPRGQVGAGIGQTTSTGTISLIAPTIEVAKTGEELVLDGVRMVFQMAPDSEAPSELHVYLPDFRALCIAENASHTLHNLLTLRGALVRDPHAWAGYLTETIAMFGDEVEVMFAGHHWPTWGNDRVLDHVSIQRDLYSYLHDQTVRLLNKGYVGAEIAEGLALPPALESTWHARGYYGTVSHNVKAVYQRYMGWYDGNPAHLWEHTPVEKATRYVRTMGGADRVVEVARTAYEEGDFRWVAELVNHVVFAEPDHLGARELLADVYEQLGYGAESGPWRCIYLSGAHELRHGGFGTPLKSSSADVVGALTASQVFDAIAIRVDGPRCWDEHLRIDVVVADTATRHRLRLRNGVLTHTAAHQRDEAQAVMTVPSAGALAGLLLAGPPDAAALAAVGVVIDGDVAVLGRLVAALDAPDPDFAIVTPE